MQSLNAFSRFKVGNSEPIIGFSLFFVNVVLLNLVKEREAMHIAKKISAFGYYENSAKTGDGVREVFQAAYHALLLAEQKGSFKRK